MTASIELVPFDPFSPFSLELGPGDEIVALESKIFNKLHQPYLVVKRAQSQGVRDEAEIWTVTSHDLSKPTSPRTLLVSPASKFFLLQRVSPSGARTGNYESYIAWLIVADKSGKRSSVELTLLENGTGPFVDSEYLGTFGNVDKLTNVFAKRI